MENKKDNRSCRKRFEGREDEVKKSIELFGKRAFMRSEGLKCELSLNNWIEEITGDKNFGENPIFNLNFRGGKTILDQILDSCIAAVLQARDEKNREIAELREQFRLQTIELQILKEKLSSERKECSEIELEKIAKFAQVCGLI